MRRAKCSLWVICFFVLLFGNCHVFSFDSLSFQRRDRVFSALEFIEPSSDYEILSEISGQPFIEQPGKVSVKLRLKNGMDVLLISDPFAVQSAAALSVEAGSWHNPEQMPGLAHFVEHLLFMGTAKYPQETDFSRYIGERGGEYNAFTSHDRTVYGFSINHEGLEGGIDRLSHFFIDPLFSSSAIAREKKAVHHEFEDHVENDALKIWRIIKETGSSCHPNAIFSCGNLDSLASVSRSDVLSWHKEHYIPSKMHLVILSAMSLKDLVSIAVKNFGAILDMPSKKSDLTGDLLSSRQRGHLICAASSFKARSLQLLWEIPKEYFQNTVCSPIELLELALDHDDEGSLSQLLADKDLATQLTIDNWKIEKEHLLFLVEVALTKKGVDQYQDVAFQVFSALAKLKQQGIPPYLYEKLYQEKHQASHYHTPSDPFSFVVDTAVALVDETLIDFPSAKHASSFYDADRAKRCLSYLTPENCAFFLLAPEKEFPMQMSLIEKWMKTPYVIRTIPQQQLTRWSAAMPDPLFSPRPENYESIEDLDNPFDDEQVLESLECVVDSNKWRVHLAQNANDEEVKVGAFFSVKSPLFSRSLRDAAKSSLYFSCFREFLQQHFVDEQFSWFIASGETEIYLLMSFEEYFDATKVKEFFAALRSFSVSEEDLQDVQSSFADNFPGDPDPLDHAQGILETILNPKTFTYVKLYDAIQDIAFAEYCSFADELFSQIRFEGVFYGDITSDDITAFTNDLNQTVFSGDDCLIVDDPDNTEDRDSYVWNGPYVHKEQTHRKGNALLLALNQGSSTREGWVIQKILAQILQEEFFDELRTKQQTAYRVFAWPDSFQGSLVHVLGLQSSTHSAEDLLQRTEAFLSDFAAHFRSKVSKERMNLIRHMLISSLKRYRQSLSDEGEGSWVASAIDMLKSISYERICSSAEIYFSSENKKRIVVLVEGR